MRLTFNRPAKGEKLIGNEREPKECKIQASYSLGGRKARIHEKRCQCYGEPCI